MMDMIPMLIVTALVGGAIFWAFKHGKLKGFAERVMAEEVRLQNQITAHIKSTNVPPAAPAPAVVPQPQAVYAPPVANAPLPVPLVALAPVAPAPAPAMPSTVAGKAANVAILQARIAELKKSMGIA